MMGNSRFHCRKSVCFAVLAVLLAVLALMSGDSAEAKAGKKTISVVTRCTSTDSEAPVRYSYNEDGTIRTVDTGTGSMVYFYNNLGLVKTIVEADPVFGTNTTSTYSYSKKGLLTKKTVKNNDTGKVQETLTFKYDGKGRIGKITEKWSEKKTVYRVVYDEKGRIKKISSTVEKAEVTVIDITYDRKNRIHKMKFPWAETTRTYTVKNGWIAKVTEKTAWDGDSGTTTKYKYKYKKIAVPKDRVNYVKEQQAGIITTKWTFGD